MDESIVDEAVSLSNSLRRKLKFKDLVIVATSKLSDMILLTVDKDFQDLPGLKVKFVEV